MKAYFIEAIILFPSIISYFDRTAEEESVCGHVVCTHACGDSLVNGAACRVRAITDNVRPQTVSYNWQLGEGFN
jgi:hypothetical protein